ncbi:MAG: M20/M25/M40 family metallo-hydrolase [Vicinamibacteria bacterium]|nr:M20/M25/M40 family metallo-hydrolase [Vicinamibacteria bacterium]
MAVRADDATSRDVNWRIRREATENSHIMKTLHVLTDVYGPRLTGSPNLKSAGEWAIKQMGSWGFTNGRLESWDFGNSGWLNQRFTAHLVSPVNDALVGEVLAWTPSTNGAVTASVVNLILPERPSQDELTTFLAANALAVKGKMVLVGRHQIVPMAMNPVNKRLDTAEARSRFDPINPAPSPFANRTPPTPAPGRLSAGQVSEQLDKFLVDSGAVARFNDAGREHGQIRAFNNRTFDLSKAVPTVVLRNEDFGRISRLVADNRPVEIALDVVNATYPDGKTSYNAVAEIPGSDKAKEVVMLGAHLDSWHAATGATDNGIGSAVTMEAARILKAIGVTPRRTIRVALWSGEEQGLLGSKAYVKAHFGTAEEPGPEYDTLAGYINIDTGTGRIRGLTVFGPGEAATVLRKAVVPFADLGVVGAISSKSRRTGGTDHTSFNAAGLPGIGTQLDPMEYQTHTWHTNLDTYERIVEDDVKAQATVIAAVVYELAMRDEKLPRFTKEEMPKVEPPATPATRPN